MECAARKNFRQMQRQDFEKLGELEGITGVVGQSTIDAAFALATKVTKAGDDEVLTMMLHRWVETQAKTCVTHEDLSQLSDISGQMGKVAQDDLGQDQKEWQRQRPQSDDCLYVGSKKKTNTAKSSEPSGATCCNKAGRQKIGAGGDNRLPDDAEPVPTELRALPSQVSHLCPPKGYMWRENTITTRNAHNLSGEWPRRPSPSIVGASRQRACSACSGG